MASTRGRLAGVPPGVASSAYTFTVETKTQCAEGYAATALRTQDGNLPTSTTASKSPRSRGRGSPRSTLTSRAPSGTDPDAPRAAHVTSWPRATASAATAFDRKTVPPRTRSRMRPPHTAPASDTTFRRPDQRTAELTVDRKWLGVALWTAAGRIRGSPAADPSLLLISNDGSAGERGGRSVVTAHR